MGQLSLMPLGRPRPSHNDPRITPLVIAALLPQMLEWLRRNGDAGRTTEDEVREDLEKVFEYESDADGYGIARSLEKQCGYSPDAELVEILESAGYDSIAAHRKLTEEWVLAESISLSLPVGTPVRVKISQTKDGKWSSQPIEYDGVIATRWEKTASYTVRIPALGHVEEGQLGTTGIILPKEEVERGTD